MFFGGVLIHEVEYTRYPMLRKIFLIQCININQYTSKICYSKGLDRTYHTNTRRKASKSPCSRAKIYKKTGQILFTAKAFNSRCLAEWLQRCVQEALQRGLPDDENQLPLLHSALILGTIYVGFCS